jgi:ATP-dependent Lon protease
MSNHKILTIDNLSLQEFDSEAELIPLLTPEDEEEMNNEELPDSLPILPLRNMVLFPGVVIPITAGRDKSIKLINDANASGKNIGVVAQKNEEDEDPTKDDIHTVGTVARILRVLKMPDGNITIILQGKKRFEIAEVVSEEPYITATVKEVPEKRPKKNDTEFNAIIDSLRSFKKVLICLAKLPLLLRILKANPSWLILFLPI